MMRPAPDAHQVPIRALLLFIMLCPLLPRPTIAGVMSLLGPSCLALLVIAFVVGVMPVASLLESESRDVERILFLLLVPTVMYGARILAQSQWSEQGYFVAKVGMSVGGLVILVWLYVAKVPVERVYHALFVGYLLLAVLMIYVGVTGNGLLEAARPPRSYGFHSPLYKAAGVPRSYGELAIFSSSVLAYLLVYRDRMKRPVWLAAVVVWVLTILIAQSRTGFIAAAVVVGGYVGLRIFGRRTVGFVLVLGVMSIPVGAQWLYPSLQSEQFVSDVIGQSTIQQNVDLRVNMYATALSWLTHPSLGLITWGVDREQWLVGAAPALGPDIVLHNYFLSTLMFSGIVGGLLSVVGLVLLPVWRLASTGLVSRGQEIVFLSTIGMTTSLQFYEGFFSLILMVQLALLWYAAYGMPVDDSESADASRTVPTTRGTTASLR